MMRAIPHRAERIPPAHLGRRGSVAMELALVSPLLMILFFGCFEVTQLVRVYMGLGVAANAVADLVSRDTPDTAANIADACNGGKLIIAPFPGTSLTVAIASVTKQASTGKLILNWTDTSCGSPQQIANPIALATPIATNPNDTVIIVQANYTYTAATSFLLGSNYVLNYLGFSRPRTAPAAS